MIMLIKMIQRIAMQMSAGQWQPGRLVFIMLVLFLANQPSFSQTNESLNQTQAIHEALLEIVNDGKAPGMIAAIASSDGIIAIASAGVRKAGSDIPFTTNDSVHLGSCTKAMTATMIATLVADEKLSWRSRLIDVMPELKESIHSDYHTFTLWQLLTHRAGISKNAVDWDAHSGKGIKARRLAILTDSLQKPAPHEIGGFHYSNFGYMIAACMAENVTGLSWESLMKERLFDPLGMSSAGFGPPNTPDQMDQPWGHSRGLSWLGFDWQPDQSDYSEVLGPAGLVHCNLADWVKFLSLFLNDENPFLDRRYINQLMSPVGHYAGGWGVAEQPWAKGKMITHNGSNERWFTFVMVAPEVDRIYIVATNSCNFGSTPKMLIELTNKIIKMDQKLDDAE